MAILQQPPEHWPREALDLWHTFPAVTRKFVLDRIAEEPARGGADYLRRLVMHIEARQIARLEAQEARG